MWRTLALPIAAFFIACGFFDVNAWADDEKAYSGTWVLSQERSNTGSSYTETVVRGHENGFESFAAEIMNGGKRSGYRYEAKSDGKPYPLFDVVTGGKIGTVTLDSSKPRSSYISFVMDDPKRAGLLFEHWLSKDGKSYASLLKSKDGAVTSVLIFEKVK